MNMYDAVLKGLYYIAASRGVWGLLCCVYGEFLR
jgi:hypothetical protein